MDFGHLVGLALGERDDPLSLCRIDLDVAAALTARTDRVRLSWQTLAKQRAHHPELDLETYRALPLALQCGQYHQDTPLTAVVIYTDPDVQNLNFRACVKCTQNGEELWATSFFKLRDSDMASLRRKSAKKNWPVLRDHD